MCKIFATKIYLLTKENNLYQCCHLFIRITFVSTTIFSDLQVNTFEIHELGLLERKHVY